MYHIPYIATQYEILYHIYISRPSEISYHIHIYIPSISYKKFHSFLGFSVDFNMKSSTLLI